ncbi:MAG TPA: transposase [Acidimicrobiales bacterium]|nr:transposase [Acidimicrobiales bacterium]
MAGLLGEVTRLRDENAALREEIARLKGHKGRPKIKPSGMERATPERTPRAKTRRSKRSTTAERVVHEERVLVITAPPGSRFKGYEDFVVQDLRLEARVIRYRRQRWLTPDGRTLVAPLPAGVEGHFGPELRRFVLLQHHQGQVTAERITAFLAGLGVAISKRQVVRLLTARSAALIAEAKAVLRAGLATACWITVDDTGARHRAKNGVTTQIGNDHFAFFATSFSKSRRNFLEILRAGHDDYVINEAALAYMRDHNLAAPVMGQLAAHPTKQFVARPAWQAHLEDLGITRLEVAPNPVKIATEGALWGSIRSHGLLDQTVIVSDDAGQFRIGRHALCWVRAERLVHQLIPFNDRQRLAIALVRQLIWWFYADLKAYQRDPCRKRRAQLRTRFDRIFQRRTGFITLDRLLARLHARKDELLLVLERPEIPLHTNGSENDIRCHVTKRKISGGTWSEAGRDARDACLGLMKTCAKQGLTFFDYLGARLGVPDAPLIAPLPDLVRARAST